MRGWLGRSRVGLPRQTSTGVVGLAVSAVPDHRATSRGTKRAGTVRRCQSWPAATLRQWLCRHDAPGVLGRTPPSRLPLQGLGHRESGSPGKSARHVDNPCLCVPISTPLLQRALHLLVISGIVCAARMWPMLHDRHVIDAVQPRAL